MRFARSTLLTIALALMVSASPSSAKCRFDVPESTMKSAHIVYTGGPGFSPAPIQAQNILRIFVLLASDGCVVEHREWLARMRWERDFKDLFDNAILEVPIIAQRGTKGVAPAGASNRRCNCPGDCYLYR